MPFAKLTKANLKGYIVGEIFINTDLIVAMFLDPMYNSEFTKIVTESNEIIFVKEKPEEIIQGFVVGLNEAKS